VKLTPDQWLIVGAIALGLAVFVALLIAIPRAHVSRPERLRPLEVRRTGKRPGLRREELEPLDEWPSSLVARPYVPAPQPTPAELAALAELEAAEETRSLPSVVQWERDIP
jgi:hypothetical protein